MGRESVEEIRRLLDWLGVGVEVDWEPVEAVLGLRLPSDFKAYVAAFPPGLIKDYLRIIQPYPGLPGSQYLSHVDSVLAQVRGVANESDPPVAIIYPDTGGLLPWGWIGFDFVFFWETSHANPDCWQVVVSHPQLTNMALFAGSMTECVVDILTGARRLPQLSYIHETWPSNTLRVIPRSSYPRVDLPYTWQVLTHQAGHAGP